MNAAVKPKTVAVLVARQGSSRLPGKSMAKILGRPVVGQIILRLQKMKLFDEIILATSHLDQDKPLIELAQEYGISSFGGHPEDVLDRLYHAAEKTKADVIVEVGGDCPLVDFEVCKKALDIFKREKADYVCNTDPQTFPDGLDIHVISMKALKTAQEKAVVSSQRKHPLNYIYKHRDQFKIVNFRNDVNLSQMRWTLDYQEDFDMIKLIFEKLQPANELFGQKEILALLEKSPEIGQINAQRVMARPEGEVPVTWFTVAYIQDMLNDVTLLSKKCSELELAKDHKQLQIYYEEMLEIVKELKERSDYFGKNNQS